MKRIVICCDGTWNRSDQAFSTNVVKLRNVVRPRAARPGGHRRVPIVRRACQFLSHAVFSQPVRESNSRRKAG